MLNDIEYMKDIPAGYVTNQIRSKETGIEIGSTMRFEPIDYVGIPMRHFHNTLTWLMGSKYGYHNMRTMLNQQSGIIEAIRLR